MDLSKFNLSLEIRIDWSDLDVYKHVNNISILRYMQSGRVNFWEATGIYQNYNTSSRGTMLVATNCDFKKSFYYPGKAIVKTRLDFIKNSSFGLEQVLLDEKGDICAVGKDVVVCYDFNRKETFRIPDELREILQRF